jgi:hypothetical protein
MEEIVRDKGRMFWKKRGSLYELFDLTFKVLDVEQSKDATMLDLELAPNNNYQFGFLGAPAIFKGDRVQLYSKSFGSQPDLSLDISGQIKLMVVYGEDKSTGVFDYHRLKYYPQGVFWRKI